MNLKSDKKLLRSIFSYSSAMVISQALMGVYTLFLIWWLSTEEYGAINANYAAVLLTSFLISLGLHDWLIRSIPFHDNPKTLTGSILIFKFIMGMIWGIVLFVFLPLIRPIIFTKQLLLQIIFDVWVESCFYLLLADLLGNEKPFKTSFLLISSRFLRLLSIIPIIITQSKSLNQVITFRLTGTIIIFIITLIITKPVFQINKKLSILKVLRSSIVFNTAEIQSLIFYQIDLTLVTIISGDQFLIGDFAIVISILSLLMTFPSGIASLILPNSIKLYKDSPNHFSKKMKERLILFLVGGALLCLSMYILRTKAIWNILGNYYKNLVGILLLASPLLFIRTINQFNRVYLLSVRWEKKQLVPYTISILIKIIFGIVFFNLYGLIGLVWVSIISELILLCGYSYQVIKHKLLFRSKIIS